MTIDLYRLPLARVLIGARGLPARISDARARRRGELTFRIRDLPAHGWLLLGERPDAQLAYGTVTKPWGALGGEVEQPVTADNFSSLSEPGYAKLAESTTVTPYGTHACILTLETRVAATDDRSRRRFQRYWRATGPFIRMIRPSVMRTLHQQLATVDPDRRPDQRRS